MRIKANGFKKRIKHSIQINPTSNNGFIVHVGCCELSYQNHEALIQDLTDFFEDPKGFEEKYHKLNHCAQPTIQYEAQCEVTQERSL